MSGQNKRPGFSATPRDALMIYRMLQVGYCVREQIQHNVFGQGDSAKVSMSRRWARMKELSYIKEKDRLFYATALGVQEVLIRVLVEQPKALGMVDQGRLSRPPNPGNTRLLFEHHKWTAEAVLYFVKRYEGLSLVKRLYGLRTAKLWGGRIQPDSAVLLMYEEAFSLFFLEIELGNTMEDFKRKLNKYARYQKSGAFLRDYEDHFGPQYKLAESENPFFRVMILCVNEQRREQLVKAALSIGDTDEADIFRLATFDEIMDQNKARAIWVRPETGQTKKYWEVE